jgi:putative lipoic acid-binding regulatory protein
MTRPVIDYPCDWSYTVIATSREIITRTVPTVLADLTYQLDESHRSKTGKFTSFNLTVYVASEVERIRVFEILKAMPTVRIVL